MRAMKKYESPWSFLPSNPIIQPGALNPPWDARRAGAAHVLTEADNFRMYYWGTDPAGQHWICTAVASRERPEEWHGTGVALGPQTETVYNDIRWTKPLPAPVVQPRGLAVEPFEYICSKPFILRRSGGKGYWLWVNTFGTAYRVHRLWSRDGLQWEWLPRLGPDGELGVGSKGAFDDVQRSYPCFVEEGTEWLCWYTGNGFGTNGMGLARKPAEP